MCDQSVTEELHMNVCPNATVLWRSHLQVDVLTSSPRYNMVFVLPSASIGCCFSSSTACLALNLKKSISSAAASISAWTTVFPWRTQRETLFFILSPPRLSLSLSLVLHRPTSMRLYELLVGSLTWWSELNGGNLSDHGLGEDFGSLGSTDDISCLEENLGSVLDGLQVPLSPRCHGRQDGCVDKLLHHSIQAQRRRGGQRFTGEFTCRKPSVWLHALVSYYWELWWDCLKDQHLE